MNIDPNAAKLSSPCSKCDVGTKAATDSRLTATRQDVMVTAFVVGEGSAWLRSVERVTANNAMKNKILPLRLLTEAWFSKGKEIGGVSKRQTSGYDDEERWASFDLSKYLRPQTRLDNCFTQP
jgi:hypothetical protein